jgi:hypothetical protein
MTFRAHIGVDANDMRLVLNAPNTCPGVSVQINGGTKVH